MGSQGGGKTTTTTNTTPWGPQQQYLQDIFGQAHQIEQEDLANPTPQASLYNQYLNAATQFGTGQLPGGDQLNTTWSNLLGAQSNLTPEIQQLIASGYNPNVDQQIGAVSAAGTTPGLQQRLQDMLGAAYNPQIDQALQALGQSGTDAGLSGRLDQMLASSQGQNAAIPGLQAAAGSQWSNPFVNAIGGALGTQNPYIQAAGGVAGTPNEYISQTGDLSKLGLANPALNALGQTASGQYLTPDTNPYLRDTVQNALDQARASIASQFNQGGRYGSGAMAGTEAQQLGNIATGAYSQAYESERARQEAAKQAMGQQYLSGAGLAAQGAQAAGALTQGQMGQQLSALLGAGGLQQGQTAQQLQGILGAGGLAGQQQGLSQQALGQMGQFGGEDLNRQLQGQQATTNAYLQNIQNQMQAQQAAASGMLQNAGLQGQAQQATTQGLLQGSGQNLTAQQAALQGQLANTQNQMTSQQGGLQGMLSALGLSGQALNFAPTYQGMQANQIGQLGNAAQVQQQLLDLPQQQRWNELANYLAMVQGGYGGTSQSQAPSAGGSNLMGQILGGGLAGAGIYSLLSARAAKREIAPVDVETIADKLLGLPINTWQYNGDDGVHIGPYAEDFRDRFGVGDGVTIKFVDMFGVLFATVQHLIVRNATLEARVEDLENGL